MRAICFFLFLLFFLNSCSHHVQVVSKECSEILLSSKSFKNSHNLLKLDRSYSSFFSSALKIEIFDVLKEHDLQCRDVEKLSYSISQDWSQTFLSLTPLYSRYYFTIWAVQD